MTQRAADNARVREEYRAIKQKVDSSIEETGCERNANEGANSLQNHLDQTNNIFEKLSKHNSREATLDASVIASLSQLSRQKASHIQGDFFSFNTGVFINQMKKFVNDEASEYISSDGWETLGSLALNYLNEPVLASYMKGTYEPKIVVPKAERVKRQDDVQIKDNPSAPEKIETQIVSSTEATTEEVDRIRMLLESIHEKSNNEPLDFFKFVVNPQSFSLTVENLFHLSFLVRDNFARVTKIQDRLYLQLGSNYDSSRSVHNSTDRDNHPNHTVFNMTFEVWENLVKGYNLQNSAPMIPPDQTQ